MGKNIKYLATFFGVGLISRFEGTVATIISGFFFILLIKIFNISSIILAGISLFLFFISYYVVAKFQVGAVDPDPREIVIDEVLGTLISLIGLPIFFNLSYILLAFIFFRILDYFKPSIIYRIQIKNTDASIILDDVVAGIITLSILLSLGLNGII